MPRKPEPWYMARRRAWFVQVDGRQIKLGDDPDPRPKGKPRPPEAAMREYYRVMATSGRTTAEDRQRATVGEVCEVFLAAKAGLHRRSVWNYAWYMDRLRSPLAGRVFNTVRKEDVIGIAESHAKWKAGTKHDFVNHVGILFRWARDAGYLDFNPFAGWTNPYQKGVRTRGLTDDEFTALIDHAKDIEFKRAMMFLRGTGCRPGEMCATEARHVHPEKALVTLGPELHKTGRRTGKSKVLVMPKDVEVMVRALAQRHPKGPIIRNSRNGGPWTPKALQVRFRRYRRLLGLSDDVVPYMIRHATLTRLLDGGTDAHLVAKIAGHADTTTLQSTYYHADVDRMLEASNKAHERRK